MKTRKCGGCGAPLPVDTSVCKFCNSENIEKNTTLGNTFDVILTETGPKKIHVIKTIREIAPYGLKEAKDLTENVPSYIKKKVSKADADIFKQMLEKVGASVDLQNSKNNSLDSHSPPNIFSAKSNREDKKEDNIGCYILIIFLVLFIGYFLFQFIKLSF